MMPVDVVSDDEDAVQVKTVWSKFDTCQQLTYDSEDDDQPEKQQGTKDLKELAVRKKKDSPKQPSSSKENSGGLGYIEHNVTPKHHVLRKTSSLIFKPIKGTLPHDETIEFTSPRPSSSTKIYKKEKPHDSNDNEGAYPLKRTYGCTDISIKSKDKNYD